MSKNAPDLRSMFAATLLIATAVPSWSGGLQVAPVTLTIEANKAAEGIWLTNVGDAEMHAQVRAWSWSQDEQGEHLVPSDGLMISPPLVALQPGARQLVRVIRAGSAPDGNAESTFRVTIDELPVQARHEGLQYVMHYSLPVFLLPAGAPLSPPQLQWQLKPRGDQMLLEVHNAGGKHAQLADLNHIGSSGQRTGVAPGLLGYVLPGATMRWALKADPVKLSGPGAMEAMVNGEQGVHVLAAADSAR